MYLIPDFPGSNAAQCRLMWLNVFFRTRVHRCSVSVPPKILASLITAADMCSLEDVQYLPTSDHQTRFSFIHIEPETRMSRRLRLPWLLNIRTHLAYTANVKKSCYMKQQSHSSESARCFDVICH